MMKSMLSVAAAILVLAACTNDREPGYAPALLDGLSPVPIDEANRIAARAPMFTRILTHPITGTVMAVDTYKPSAAMRRFLAARDVHCRFPGCRLPARGCQIDHTQEWQHGGKTCTTNLEHLCVFHHVMRHAAPWSVDQLEGGVLDWKTPSGKALTDRPERQGVRFVPTDELATLSGAESTPTNTISTTAETTSACPPEAHTGRDPGNHPPPF